MTPPTPERVECIKPLGQPCGVEGAGERPSDGTCLFPNGMCALRRYVLSTPKPEVRDKEALEAAFDTLDAALGDYANYLGLSQQELAEKAWDARNTLHSEIERRDAVIEAAQRTHDKHMEWAEAENQAALGFGSKVKAAELGIAALATMKLLGRVLATLKDSQ